MSGQQPELDLPRTNVLSKEDAQRLLQELEAEAGDLDRAAEEGATVNESCYSKKQLESRAKLKNFNEWMKQIWAGVCKEEKLVWSAKAKQFKYMHP